MTTTPPNADQKPPPKVNARITDRGWDLIVERAAAADITASHMVRRMLAYAAEHMPPGYVPRRNAPAGVKRKKLSVRSTDQVAALVTQRAATADVVASHMVRRMLSYSAEHMPAGWVPGQRARAEAGARARRR